MSNGNVITQINLVGAQIVDIDATVNVFVDPSSDFVESNVSRPAVAARTSGPHRYTIVAPHTDAAVLNIGQACPTRINDTGITGRTRSHIHWHVTDVSKTMLCLGGGTREGFVGHAANNLESNAGFMAVTEGYGWLEANQHQYLISRVGDATLRTAGAGKRVRLQADQGEIDLVAMNQVYVSSPGVSISAPGEVTPNTEVNYQGSWTGALPKAHSGGFTKWLVGVLGAMAAAHDLGKKAIKTVKTVKDGKWKHTDYAWKDVAKWAVDFTKFAAFQAPSALSLWGSSDPKGGAVKIAADDHASILAGQKTSIFGGLAYSAGGGIWATVAAGISASVKGRVFAGLGGMYSSVKGYRQVEIGSDYGKAVLSAKKEVSISGGTRTEIGGVDAAQLSSEKDVLINAGEHVNIGCGGGDGVAVTMEPTKMYVGSHSSVDAIKSAPAKADHLMTIDVGGDEFRIQWNDSRLKIKNNDVQLLGEQVNINSYSGDTKIDGNSIHLG